MCGSSFLNHPYAYRNVQFICQRRPHLFLSVSLTFSYVTVPYRNPLQIRTCHSRYTSNYNKLEQSHEQHTLLCPLVMLSAVVKDLFSALPGLPRTSPKTLSIAPEAPKSPETFYVQTALQRSGQPAALAVVSVGHLLTCQNSATCNIQPVCEAFDATLLWHIDAAS